MIRIITENRSARIQTRNDGDGNPTAIFGYAAVFYRSDDPGTEYSLWWDYLERIMPGAFDRAISESHDARCLFNHNPDNLLGRVASGTCNLAVDTIGLRFEIPVDADDPDHRSVLRKIQRGDLTGCSFAFSNPTATWEETKNDDGDTIWIRQITDLDLHDVGPVTYPAYESTDVGFRDNGRGSAAGASHARRSCVIAESDFVESRSILDAHRKSLQQHQQQRDLERIEIDSRWLEIQQQQS